MTLFVPTSISAPKIGTELVKGQLYALDLDQSIDFQFNPKTFGFKRDFNWSRNRFKGDDTGGTASFNSLGTREFDLDLIFIADPSAPVVNFEADEDLVPKDSAAQIDFEAFKRILECWELPIVGLGRPTKFKVIVGENDIDCIMTAYEVIEQEFFPDLTVQEARVMFSFEEWIEL
jgi:hypothetical protein